MIMKTIKPKSMKVFLFLLLLSIKYEVFSQTTINASANSVVLNGTRFDYSIGEMSLINTQHNAGLIVTQGYLQPEMSSNSSIALSSLYNNILVYPNPTENRLILELDANLFSSFSYQLLDINGKVVISKTETSMQNKYILDLSPFVAGTYLLSVMVKKKDLTTEKLSYKIQKVG
jgi:hypothetical protein